MPSRSAATLVSLLLCFAFVASNAIGQAESSQKSETGKSSSRESTQHDPVITGVERETYEGHLVTGDVSFKLHLFEGNRATAEWVRDPGKTQKYSGSFSGSDGNYAVQLKGDAPERDLNLTLRSTGGMVQASYTNHTGQNRAFPELKLTGVSSPNVKLRGTSTRRNNVTARNRQSGTRTNTRNARNNANRQIRIRSNTRRGRVIVPGVRRSYRP